MAEWCQMGWSEVFRRLSSWIFLNIFAMCAWVSAPGANTQASVETENKPLSGDERQK